MQYVEIFNDYDEEEVARLFKIIKGSVTSSGRPTYLEGVDKLFEWLYFEAADSGSSEYLFKDFKFISNTEVVYSGSGEYSSQESTTSVWISLDGKDLAEIYYSIGCALCGEHEIIAFEVIPLEEEETDEELCNRLLHMSGTRSDKFAGLPCPRPSKFVGEGLDELAKLYGIKRLYKQDGSVDNETGQDYHTQTLETKEKAVAKLSERVPTSDSSKEAQPTNSIKSGETNMNTLRTVNVTILDNNTNLKGEEKIVFQELNFVTEYNDTDTKMNIIADGGVKAAIIKHNVKRGKTVDKAIRSNTGRDVMLEPIEKLSDAQLEWRIVTVA